MEVIKITEQNGKQAVSARELYEFLGFNKAHWAKWYRKNIEENEFALQGVDFETFALSVNGNDTKDFALSLDFAKKISMMARTEKGEQARDYFIACEKAVKNPTANLTRIDLARMVIEAEEENQRLQIVNARLQNRSDVYDKVFGAEKYLTGSQVCKVLDLGYGNITLYKKLREIGIFFKNKNEPMQQYANKKWVMLKEKWIDGKDEPVVTPYFSQTFIPHLAIKLGAVVNNLTKIQSA